MLFSYIVGHVPVNFRKKILKNEKVIKKIQNLRFFFTDPLFITLNMAVFKPSISELGG